MQLACSQATWPARGFEQGKAVVFDGPVPEEGADVAGDVGEIAEEPAGEVDEVDALVEHFAAAGDGGVAAPFLLHAEPAAVAVAAADEHERADAAGVDDLAGLAQRGMEAVVEADFHDDARLGAAAAMTGRSSAAFRAAGFSTSTCFPACDRRKGDRRQACRWWSRR